MESRDVCSVRQLNCTDNLEVLRRRILAASGLSELFRVLADETRTRILYVLAEQELCVCDLAWLLEMSMPAVSHHLRLLKLMRMIRGERRGKQVFYSLQDHHVLTLIRTAQEHFAETQDV
ncbi:ArsR/SmtB family transcription factor [Spirochaeta africana]|uniref:Putative transcriptional regulator n=1 Tax=Spirochaeta africana (strain ATCC 700263 / DSM 8902 / Z-7692) TaxID=889378 RepID=H9UL80_SPIAZ|nr:metalloregulator ArsR/SmtB family transcription factor [Spirochaeta africana]AFG38273.1 putative transcriptional regulator [Spirochaeta africana DSM 8902]